RTSSASTAGAIASQMLAVATAAVAAHPIEENASVKVASRDDTCRRRNWLRLAWLRNQNCTAVEAAAAIAIPAVAIRACHGDATAIAATKGAKMRMTAPSTASILALRMKCRGTGAVATRSGASSPEIASHA